MYHIVCPAKYWRAVIDEEVDKKLREVCLGIEARYEIRFVEIGTEPMLTKQRRIAETDELMVQGNFNQRNRMP
jgi:hypothetical protein